MILNARATVNLHLDIGPRRSDGYHSLKTLFQEISLSDTLRFTPAVSGIRFSVASDVVTAGADNLVVRALTLLQKELKTKKGIKVSLTKHIPMGAGLGGGSSDAGAALLGGWAIWKRKKVVRDQKKIPPILFKCARKLGADVPFFLIGGTAWAEGIGDILKPVPSQPKRWMILVYPRVHVATPLAYKLLDQSRKPSSRHVLGRDLLSQNHVIPAKQHAGMTVCFNSFEPVILKKFPAIARAKQKLIKLGCTDVMMSGSGSTVFGFVKNSSDGRKVLRQLKKHRWDSFLAHTTTF